MATNKENSDYNMHPSQEFWISFAKEKIPEELLSKQNKDTTTLLNSKKKLTTRYKLTIASTSLIAFTILAYVFGRFLALF